MKYNLSIYNGTNVSDKALIIQVQLKSKWVKSFKEFFIDKDNDYQNLMDETSKIMELLSKVLDRQDFISYKNGDMCTFMFDELNKVKGVVSYLVEGENGRFNRYVIKER